MQQKPMDSLGGTSNSDMQFDGTQKEKEQGRQNKICEELVTGLDSTERTGGEADGSDPKAMQMSPSRGQGDGVSGGDPKVMQMSFSCVQEKCASSSDPKGMQNNLLHDHVNSTRGGNMGHTVTTQATQQNQTSGDKQPGKYKKLKGREPREKGQNSAGGELREEAIGEKRRTEGLEVEFEERGKKQKKETEGMQSVEVMSENTGLLGQPCEHQ